MKKNSSVFLDSSAWLAVVDPDDPNHEKAREYFRLMLERGARAITNNIVIDQTLQTLRSKFGTDLSRRFLEIIDESTLSVNLRVDWISRRVRRSVIQQFLKSSKNELTLDHFYIYESLKRKKADFVFSFDPAVKHFKYPVIPQ